MKLILVRHGQTEENKKHIWQGHAEGTLSKEGRNQSKKLAKRLEKEDIAMIYCSDLQRTRDTIKPLLKRKNIPTKYIKELRERNLGVLEGMTTEKVEEYMSRNNNDFNNQNFETGETFYEMRNRIVKFYNTLSKKNERKSILIMTHGGAVSQIMLFLFKYSINKFLKFIPKNTGVTEIEIKKGKPKLLNFNDVSHL